MVYRVKILDSCHEYGNAQGGARADAQAAAAVPSLPEGVAPTRAGSVSCTDIGAELKLDPTQVRKDLEAAGIAGRPRIGYATAAVMEGIEGFLGWKKVNEAFLVGAGSMGSALLGYRKFEECGLKIVAAFDSDPAKIGQKIHGKHVLPLEKLADLARRMHVLIGIITVPAARGAGGGGPDGGGRHSRHLEFRPGAPAGARSTSLSTTKTSTARWRRSRRSWRSELEANPPKPARRDAALPRI